MGLAVVTVASGGLPVVDVTGIAPRTGTPVTEAANGRGIAVTKVVGKSGMPVVFETIGVAAPVTYATLDPATVTAVTLSGGNLVATNTGTTATSQGAKVASASGKTTGKYYFEGQWTAVTSGVGSNYGFGIGTFASTYTGMGSGGTTGVIAYFGGSIYSNGSSTGFSSGGTWIAGQAIGVAVDLDNRRFWIRFPPSGNWNGNVANNPATNVGGAVIPAGVMVPFVTFGGTTGAANNVFTSNFGASAFVGAVPAGFTSGWPA